jgi:methyl-galactoside transport system substrate-binding protein
MMKRIIAVFVRLKEINIKKRVVIVIALVVAAATLLPVIISSRDDKNNPVIKIGVCIYRGDDTFITNMMESLTQLSEGYEEKNHTQINLSITDGQNSQSIQDDQVERLIALDYDVLCINLVDRTRAASIIDMAMEANIPIVFFNREPVQEDMKKWDRLYYVGTDAQLNGKMEGQIVVDAYNASPSSIDRNGDGILQYIMIEGEIRHQDSVLRTEGSVQAIRDAGIQVEKIDGGIASWERSQSAALAEEYFNNHRGEIELIICNNDDMALGVIDTVNRLGLNFKNIVGIDGTPQGLEAVEKSQMLGTVVIDYNCHAQIILDLAYSLATGSDPHDTMIIGEDKTIRAPMYTITSGMH